MKTITTEFRGKKRTFKLPEEWKEITPENFGPITEMLPALKKGLYADEQMRRLCKAGKREWRKTGRDQKLLLAMQLGEIARQRPENSENLTGKIRLKGKTYEGFSRMFSNMTWGEFIWADTFFLLGRPEELAATLWREKKKGGRVPFDEHGLQQRTKLFRKHMPPEKTAMILLNYSAVRKTALEDIYTELFPRTTEVKDDIPDEYKKAETKKEEENAGAKFSWFETHSELMGERFFLAEKYENARLSTVLMHLNSQARKAKESRRKRK